MKYSSRTHNTILIIESVGFLLTMILIWVNERFDLPHILFNGPETPYNIPEVIMNLITIGILGAFVLIMTHRVLNQIRYLGDFYRICAGCKKVVINGKWISIEELLHTYGEVDLSHGLCEECAQKYLDELK